MPTHCIYRINYEQRCKWAKKDPVFMAKHYQKLEDVGFLWKVKDRTSAVPFEARLQQLVRFMCTLLLSFFDIT